MASNQPSPKEMMREYLDAVESGDNERAVKYFAPDVIYRHPLIDGEIYGRESVKEFLDERGEKEGAHEIDHTFDRWVITDDAFAVQGSMTGPRGEDKFISFVELEDGLISFYNPGLLRGIWNDEQ